MAPDFSLFNEPLMSGEELRKIREGLHLNQDALAQALGFAHRSTIAAYESGYVVRRKQHHPVTIPDELAERVIALAMRRHQERLQKRNQVLFLLGDLDHAC